MRAIGIGIADALHDRDAAILKEIVEPGEGGVEPDAAVDLDDAVFANADRRPHALIRVVGIRHDGIEPVVPAAHLNDDEDVVGIDRTAEHRERFGIGDAAEKRRNRSAEDRHAE